MKKRSIGVRFYGVLFTVVGTYGVLYALLRLTAVKSTIFPPSEFIIGGVISLGCLANGIGVLRLKHWAYWMTLIGNGAWLLFGVAGSVRGTQRGDTNAWWALANSLVWCGVIFWYFLRPGVKAQFVRAATSDK